MQAVANPKEQQKQRICLCVPKKDIGSTPYSPPSNSGKLILFLGISDPLLQI